MKFRYYIVDCVSFEVKGTNDRDVLGPFTSNEDFIVIDAELGRVKHDTGYFDITQYSKMVDPE